MNRLYFEGNIYKIILIIVLIKIYSKYLLTIKVGLCVIGKNENLYIREFIDYYYNLGYNHIYLYDNNDINGERFEDIIQDYIKIGFVSLIDYRGIQGSNINPQLNAYRDCYDKFNMTYNWLSFFDIDEYLEINPSYSKIQNFLSSKRYAHCQNIKINWVYYTNNNSLYYENKPLQKRVNIPIYNLSLNQHIKSTVKGNLSKNFWSLANNPHTSLINFTTCSSSGRIINFSSPLINPPDYKYAYIKHYQNKSFEEYCLKIKRGRPVPQFDEYRNLKIKLLFYDNKNNSEKLHILRKVFNLSNYSQN